MTTHRATRAKQRLLWWSIGGTLISVIVIATGLLIWAHKQEWASIRRNIDVATPWLTLWRVMFVLLLIGGWPLWVQRLARRYRWDEGHIQRVRRLRWPVAGWLLLIELVVGQHIFGRIST